MQHKRSVIILIFNDKGELALQKRAQGDISYPGHWDFSSAGGIEKDEDPTVAAHRELKEELGVEANLEFIGKEFYTGPRYTSDMYVYKTTYNGPFKLQKEEVEDVQFFPVETIQKMLKTEKFHEEFPFLWKKYLVVK